jgi:hypothetical protein
MFISLRRDDEDDVVDVVDYVDDGALLDVEEHNDDGV